MSVRLLLVDAGNTRVKWAVAGSRGAIRLCGEMATSGAKATWVRRLAREFSGYRVVLATVVPRLVSLFEKVFGERMHRVTGRSRVLGLEFDYPRPAELGADRLASAVAAHALGRWPVIVVNCGTATAFTVLDGQGRLCGGVIAPGLQTQLAALLGATAQLPATGLRRPRQALARSTQEAIRAGVMLGFQGGVKEILRALIGALPKSPGPGIVLTGGNARHLAGSLDGEYSVRPLLVFEGLRIMGSRLLPTHDHDI